MVLFIVDFTVVLCKFPKHWHSDGLHDSLVSRSRSRFILKGPSPRLVPESLWSQACLEVKLKPFDLKNLQLGERFNKRHEYLAMLVVILAVKILPHMRNRPSFNAELGLEVVL